MSRPTWVDAVGAIVLLVLLVIGIAVGVALLVRADSDGDTASNTRVQPIGAVAAPSVGTLPARAKLPAAPTAEPKATAVPVSATATPGPITDTGTGAGTQPDTTPAKKDATETLGGDGGSQG
jgi:hypothetical protein